MSFTKVLGPGIHTEANINSHNIKSTGIITATALDISGNITVGGTITYEDVTNVDSVGIITARSGIQGIGIQSGGVNVAVGVLTITGIVFFEPSAEFSRSSCDPGLEQLTNKINIVITKKTDDKYILIIL